MSELVQPIAVAKSGSHEHVVAAVARASVLAWLDSTECCRWDDWLAGRFTKSVRRGSRGKIEEIVEENYAVARVPVGEAVAVGCVPMTYEEMPPELRKFRVADFERERTGQWEPCTRGPRITINADVEMSTGKTAAQVAHALFGYMMKRTRDYHAVWRSDDLPVQIEVLDNLRWKHAVRDAEVVITDAGLTEVASGTTTVVAR